MFIFICEICNKTKELSKSVLEIIDGKVRTKNAQCDCGNEMREIEKKRSGFPNLLRTEPTLSKN